MEIKDGIPRRGEEVASGVASSNIVAGGVDPLVVGLFAAGRGEQGVVEGVDVGGLGDEVVGVVGCGAEGGVDVDVAAHAARIGAGVVGDVVHYGGLGA